ncbi:MAG TPA: hypothetical protein VNP37_15270 [Actinomycetospora sp.]|nr:hypothetical protein [Actinomycetospora sp.]
MNEPLSETPRDATSERSGVRSRIAAGVGVGLVGAASLSTAVFQTITQSSTTVGMPGTIAEIDTPLPWGVPVSGPLAPAAADPTITPTVADLDLRADRQPLPAPAATSPGAGPVVGAPPEARPERATTGGRRPVSSTPGTSGSTRPTTLPGTTSPGRTPSTEPTTEPTTSPAPQDTTEPPEPSTEPSSEASTEPSTDPSPDPSEPAPEPSTSPAG